MSDFWFGDIAVGILTEKDTEISKEVVEKNFVDESVQVYELTPNLESGSYSLYFNQDMHPRSESLEEQRDGVLSMPERHSLEFPINIGGDKGHIVVEESNVSYTPSEMLDEGNINLRFMDDDSYRPALMLETVPLDDSISWDYPASVVAVPSNASVDDDAAVTSSPLYTLTTEDGDLDLYGYLDYGKAILKHDRLSDYTSGERISPVRVFNSSDKRVYSSSKVIYNGSKIKNGKIRCTFNSNNCGFEFYDGGWNTIGDINFDVSEGYLEKPSNYHTRINFVEDGYSCSQRRGFSAMRFDVQYDNFSSFTINFDDSVSFGTQSSSPVYYRSVISDSTGNEFVLFEPQSGGDFNDDSSTLEIDNLQGEYSIFFGYVPSSVNTDNFVKYLYYIGKQQRTLVQK